jgi:GH24 family phage-related lysozyme (muramidase)
MKIIITESQLKNLLTESMADDAVLRDSIKSFESTVIDSAGRHYVFDDKDPKKPKTFVTSPNQKAGGKLTIGWGHTGEQAKIGNRISNAKAEQLLTLDIKREENKAKSIFPKYSNYPIYVQRALVNATFRGEAKTSYQWVKAINSGNWDLAAKKYLEGWDIDFSQANDPKYEGGIADRMVENQKVFLRYANELKGKKPQSKTPNKSTETEKQMCQRLAKKAPIEVARRPECDKYFKSNYHRDYGYDFSKYYYTVKPGDTLSGIAAKYGKSVTVEKLKKMNNLKSDNIQPGQKLKVR